MRQFAIAVDNDALVRGQIGGSLRHTVAREIGRAGADAAAGLSQLADNQIRIIHRPGTDRHIDVLIQQVHLPVRHAEFDRDIGIARYKA
jgi:hypothetical protein